MSYDRELPKWLRIDVSEKSAQCNHEAIERFSAYLKNLPEPKRYFNFYSEEKDGVEVILSDMYPPLNHPEAINFFFYVCSQWFGFWYRNCNVYIEPLSGLLDGEVYKESDLFFRLAMRAFNRDQEFFQPSKLTQLTPMQFADFLSDDNGPIPFPDWEERYCLTTSYGGSRYWREDFSPTEFVNKINQDCDRHQLNTFCDWLCETPGYIDNYLNNKSKLLAMVLANRPEKFLKINPEVEWPPIINHHLTRLVLRLGLLDINKYLADDLKARSCVSRDEVGGEVFNALCQVSKLSGKPTIFFDYLMRQVSQQCSEISTPECGKCQLQSVCAQRIELFQPVCRTTFY